MRTPVLLLITWFLAVSVASLGGCQSGRAGGGGGTADNANANDNGSEGNDNQSSGANFYVAPDGDDDNPGTEDEPWRTIQKAADSLVAGETVYIRAGTYEERVVPLNSGAADEWITYTAYPDETVTIDGAAIDVPEWGGLFDISGPDYIRVRSLRITNAGPNLHNPGIQVDGSSHIIVENNYVSNTMDSGIAVWNSFDVMVDGNEVVEACQGGYNECISVGVTDGFELRNNLVYNSQKEGICTKDGSSNGSVYGNEVYGTEAAGFYVDAQARHTFNIEVFNNIAHDIVEDGFAIASEVGGLLENVRVYNNIAYHNGWVGIHVTDCCIETHPLSNIEIINNTLYDNGWDPWGGGIAVDNTQAEGIVVRNNICSQNLSFQIAVATNVPEQSVTVNHNLIDGYRGGAEGETYGEDHLEGDPGFVNATDADFHLGADSPAIDGGLPDGAPEQDYDGERRPAGGDIDVGADEYAFP